MSSNGNGILDDTQQEIIENPYHPYDLEKKNWFYHKDLIKQIKEIFNIHQEERFISLQGNPGSGKTSTLKQIAESPGLLGDKYIPVYLDSRDYMDINKNDLLFFIYNDVLKRFIKLGFETQEADIVKIRHKRGFTVESIIMTVDSLIRSHNKNSVLVLIFDEFDKLLEHTPSNVIADNIRYFEHIDKSWSNYGLILAGDKKLANLTREEKINRFLGKAFDINIEKSLNENTIRGLITNPVKNRYTYDEAAVKKILRYSGKNFYFQQLICDHVFKYIKEAKKNRCSETDVDRAIRDIVNEPVEEFVFGWENKISPENRLIASALVDDTITEKKGGYYYLKENTLLDEIFGEKLLEKIEELSGFGYFTEIESRRFSQHPFKIPLYGEWIKARYPFIDTLVENLDKLLDTITPGTLKRIITETSQHRLWHFDHKEIMNTLDNWIMLKASLANRTKDAERISRNHIKKFMNNTSKILNLNLKESKHTDECCYILDIKKLSIGNLEEGYCFIQDSPELDKEDIIDIENNAAGITEEDQKKATLFFYFQESLIIENFVKKPYLNLIALKENDLKKIIIATKPRETFKKIILSKLSLQKVSPYKTAGPAKATFYGRSDIINRIGNSKNQSFSIIGARRIGKTSLLDKLYDDPPPDASIVYLNLELYFPDNKGNKKFLQALEEKINHEFKKKSVFGKLPFTRNISKLPNILRDLVQPDKRIIFLFDEVDGLLEFDRQNHYEIMRTFRTLAQKNFCQFIFAGFKELFHVQRDIENPLYNFCEEMRLKPLDKQSGLELITKPMESIGVHYKNNEDRKLILFYTGCHPHLLQYYCKTLLERVERHEKVEDRRIIFAEDIEDIYNREYQDYILDDVYLFSTEMSALNRLILTRLAQNYPEGNGTKFSITEIKNLLTKYNLNINRKDLHIHLKYLIMRFALLDEGKDIYKFAIPVFPEILRKRIDDYYVDELIEEIKSDEIKSL